MPTEYIYLETVESTNVYASKQVSKTNPQHPKVYFTTNQSGGTGQFGRKWYSGKDKNLSLSIVYPWKKMTAAQNINILMTVSLAIQNALMVLTGLNSTIKWPNDIYYDDKKLGGVLIQNVLKGSKVNYSIIGIGINVNTKRFPRWVPNPISVSQIENKDYELDNFARLLSSAIIQYLDIRESLKFKTIKTNYLKNLYKYKKELKYKNKKGVIKWGTLHDVNDNAHLVIKDSDGELHSFDHGELSMIV